MVQIIKIREENKENVIQDIIDALPFYVLIVDERHNIVRANQAVINQLGLKPEDMIGKYCPKVVHGIDTSFHGCPLEESVQSGEAIVKEVFDDRSGLWLSSAIYPMHLYSEEGFQLYLHMVMDISEKKSFEEEQSITKERFRSLSAYLEKKVEEERQKIARDLHDDISQVIASINAHLSTAINKLPEGSEDSREILLKTQDFSVKLLDRIHSLIYQLRPTILDDFGLVAAIEWLYQNSLEISGISVVFKTFGSEVSLRGELRTIIFRIFQEIFNNIVKHSKAKTVQISVFFRKDHIRLKIKDNGVGFDLDEAINSNEKTKGMGLIGIEERVEYLHGHLEIKSSHDRGTEIHIKVPYTFNERKRSGRNRKYLWS